MNRQDRCTAIRRFTTIRSIQEFAALWCGCSEDDLPIVLAKTYGGGSTSLGSIIVRSDDYPCLEPRIRFIIDAINDGRVEACDELGSFRGKDNISWKRMCLRMDKAREWLENSALPLNELPAFLFSSQAENLPATVAGLEEAQKRIHGLEEALRERDARIAELELLTTATETGEDGPVNAKRWRLSCHALARAFAAYINRSGPENITKEQFLEFLKNRVENFRNPLGTVENIAWQELPQSLKSGPGRPRKQYEETGVPF
ncbi:hypothetical protein [Anaeromusa sp.]|uniref:hypothetical protein n=1 Tax=Anaeromusa sp. TaxID=1872520 RepID=UPI00261DC48B|nr:hypothetical protein [Anaeromusa sp.]MDD3159320.1 hypothetical protein [Anaeromusa sp.]